MAALNINSQFKERNLKAPLRKILHYRIIIIFSLHTNLVHRIVFENEFQNTPQLYKIYHSSISLYFSYPLKIPKRWINLYNANIILSHETKTSNLSWHCFSVEYFTNLPVNKISRISLHAYKRSSEQLRFTMQHNLERIKH